METEFTPILSLVGGMLIGLSAVLLMAFNGRIAGISGIVARLLPNSTTREGIGVGLAFVVGLLLAAPIYTLAKGGTPEQTITGGFITLAIAGLLVGFGSAYGNGCTSGHGVCGISRFSGRSIVATITFMATAFVTVLVIRHVL